MKVNIKSAIKYSKFSSRIFNFTFFYTNNF